MQLKQLYVVSSNFPAMFTACGLMAVSQLSGFNSILYYSGTLFAAVGFNQPVAVGASIAATNSVFTWINLFLVDRIGRWRILMHMPWVMAAALVVAVHWIPLNKKLEVTTSKSGWPADMVLVCMLVYVAFYFLGAGNIAWMSSESYPIEVRAVGTMFLTMN